MVQKFKFFHSKWNLLFKIIRICRIQWWCSLHLFQAGNTLFGQVWSKKIEIVSFSWNFVLNLIQIWRIHCWFSLFQSLNGGIFFMANFISEIVSFSWNLEPRPIRICKIRWWCFFLVLDCFLLVVPKISTWHFDVTWLNLPAVYSQRLEASGFSCCFSKGDGALGYACIQLWDFP